jgi:hypothetical protein
MGIGWQRGGTRINVPSAALRRNRGVRKNRVSTNYRLETRSSEFIGFRRARFNSADKIAPVILGGAASLWLATLSIALVGPCRTPTRLAL